jgi:hypothetical protein
MNLRRNLAVLAALILALTACSKKEEPAKKVEAPPAPTASAPSAGVTVSAITLGTAVGPDKKVTKGTDTFGPKDTIYASVDTTGSGTATLKSKWTYRKDGKEAIVKEDTMTIAPTGAATNEFHISKPDGWPAGNYQVEIFVADKSAGTKAFTVK